MKNPFKKFRHTDENPALSEQAPITEPEPAVEPSVEEPAPDPPAETAPADPFVEWCRTRVQGGIERRERNDIYEAYSVYGVDENGRLTCRLYHRYPEHERDFGLSYSRQLSFDEFNRRLLSELDKGSLPLSDYHACLTKAEQLTGQPRGDAPVFEGFSEEETAALRGYCDAMDNLTDKEYRTAEGVFRCSCRSAVGDDTLCLWFRKPLPHDAADTDVAGVEKKPIEGYDIDSLWIMGVYNRLHESCSRCQVALLTSSWSLEKESVYLMTLEGFPDVAGTVLLAVSDAASFPRFGFYSLDFSRK